VAFGRADRSRLYGLLRYLRGRPAGVAPVLRLSTPRVGMLKIANRRLPMLNTTTYDATQRKPLPVHLTAVLARLPSLPAEALALPGSCETLARLTINNA
jgi:hypothetical protein